MSKNNKASDRINGKKLIKLSENLGAAYGSGLDEAKPGDKTDFWTVDKLISMSRHLSSAYGVDV